MIKQILRISFFTVFFVGLVIIARAQEVKGHIQESLEYRQTSYNINFTDRSHLLRDKRKAEDKAQDIIFHKARSTQVLHEQEKRENYDYARVLKQVSGIVPGITTDGELIRWFGLADEVLTGDTFIPFEVTASMRSCTYHLYIHQYPKPAEDQFIFARSFYFQEMRAPFVGNKLDILVTINRDTGIVDYYACYNEDGVILTYWRNNLITEG